MGGDIHVYFDIERIIVDYSSLLSIEAYDIVVGNYWTNISFPLDRKNRGMLNYRAILAC
jgi:hypothetical protein